ncbi:triose-phosphate isomerase [Saccharomycopsis crataegensis]|uniref:Triosephosphate isomerase n=1 Tax=Saccharomycopsis crataegensis TaxID=43959 RepID=A0AAV5QHG6_9ASCO|nr:triose-phosphate isomerase [Saccharomycopsis crataegensis]
MYNKARTFFVGGNFKMNGSLESVKSIVDRLNESKLAASTEVVIAPPAPYLYWAAQNNKKSQVFIAAQNSYDKASGAYTGEISVNCLKDVGATWVILGHSERRTILKETDEMVASKTKFALDNGVKVILCIGETLEERKAGITLEVCARQLDAVSSKVSDWSDVVVAYEPVWAIGTGLAATPEDAEETHVGIRKHLASTIGAEQAEKVRILYGGSVNGKNANTFKDKANIDGFLVGGASLKPEFVDIINSRE